MSITDGQRVNAATDNAAFLSRTTDSNTVGIIDLDNASSGGTIANAQQTINTNTAGINTNATDISTLQSTKEDNTSKGIANGYAALDSKAQLKITPIVFAFVASQTGSNVTGLIFDSAEYESATVKYTINTATLFERGQFDVIFDGSNWAIHSGYVVGDDSLVTFSGIDATTGQVEYDSDVETGTMKFTYEAFTI